MNPTDQALAKARSLVAIRRWREAMDMLGPPLTGGASAGEAHCLRAQCLLGLGQPGQAAGAARQALAARPDSEWAHRLLGIAYLRTRHRRAALAEAAEAVRLAPRSVHALHVLAICELANRRRAAADRTARAAVEANPQEPLAHLTLAKTAAARKDHDTAERAYREGLRLAPDNHDLALGLGQLMHRLGRRDEAATAYLAAAHSNPADARARRGLARLGLPVTGAGVYAAAKVVGILGVSHTLIGLRPAFAALIVGTGLLLGGLITTALRVRGTRRLPAPVRQGLRADHRNAALRWLRLAAVAALILAIWAAALPTSAGGGAGEAVLFAVFAAAAAYTVHRLWAGPRRSAAQVGRALGKRFFARRLS